LGSGSTHVIVTVVLLENNDLVDAFVMPSAAGRRLRKACARVRGLMKLQPGGRRVERTDASKLDNARRAYTHAT